MPIYMDRHDIEGATAKAVAGAHQKDLKLQDKYGVKLLTYWFDEGRGSAFCLMDAAAKEKVKQLHEEAHGSIDGFMVAFTSASHAVACAIAIQRSFASHNKRHPDTKINVRIGICAGEPVEEDQRLFGSTVQLTSRICDKAEPDQILVAPVIRDLCIGKQFSFTDRGESALKGFDQPFRMYEAHWQEA